MKFDGEDLSSRPSLYGDASRTVTDAVGAEADELDHLFNDKVPAQPTDLVGRKYVLGKDMLKALHAAGLLPQYPMCSRVVIDIQPNKVVSMYVNQIPSGALLNIVPLMTEDTADGEEGS